MLTGVEDVFKSSAEVVTQLYKNTSLQGKSPTLKSYLSKST